VSAAEFLIGVMWLALTCYVGSRRGRLRRGVWDLLAGRARTGNAQRRLIEQSITQLPGLTIDQAAARPEVLHVTLAVITVGAVLLIRCSRCFSVRPRQNGDRHRQRPDQVNNSSAVIVLTTESAETPHSSARAQP
jgi:hypothetical protein